MTISQLVKKYDSQNQFKILKDTHKQVSDIWATSFDVSALSKKKFSSIVYCGLGGSAISGDLLRDYLSSELKIPFEVIRGYNLPFYVNQDTLVIISSYSGNTEESISCFEQALIKKPSIVVITSGGKIGQLASANKIPMIQLQTGFQPRYALGQGFFALLKLFHELGYSDEKKNVERVSVLWKNKAEEYSTENNIAIYIASDLIGFIPVIYSSEYLTSTGYRLKCQFNENSKLHAFHNVIPEMNHNEIIGWETIKEKQFNTKVVYLIDEEYHPQNKKRFNLLNEFLSEQKVEVLTLKSNEENKKGRIMDLIFLCDWISFYASVLRGFDPSEIDFIHRMKQKLT